VQIPAEAMEAARHETYRFLINGWLWQGDLQRLCALCYLQGALDGAQVQATLTAEAVPPPHDKGEGKS
jgi:hypothetical protein